MDSAINKKYHREPVKVMWHHGKKPKVFLYIVEKVESMDVEMVLLGASGVVIILSALGVLLSKDNFYSALYMTITLVMVATVYALFNLQPVFVLIVFVFIGAIGIVTVALAATYRAMPERQFSWVWCIPAIITITAVVIGISISISSPASRYQYQYPSTGTSEGVIPLFKPAEFLKPEYQLLLVFLASLAILLFLSVLKFYRAEES